MDIKNNFENSCIIFSEDTSKSNVSLAFFEVLYIYNSILSFNIKVRF